MRIRSVEMFWSVSLCVALSACAASQATAPRDSGGVDGGMPFDLGSNDADGAVSPLMDLGVVESDLGGGDTGEPIDSGNAPDLGAVVDAGVVMDAGTTTDAGTSSDAGVVIDLGVVVDSAVVVDGGVAVDSGVTLDAGSSSPTTILVVRVGTGSSARNSSATAVFLDSFALDGTPMGSTPLPTTTTPLTMSGSATSEGCLTLSADGHYVTLAGYAAAPGVGSIASTLSSSVPRVVARVNSAYAIEVSTRTTTGFDQSNIRSAATVDGTQLWMGGNGSAGGDGVQFEMFGATTSTQVASVPDNTRCVGIFGGQLYASSAVTGYTAVHRIGSGLPTGTGNTATALPGMTTTGASPYGFVLLDRDTAVAGMDTAYVADDRAASSGGGVQKWVFNGATWTLATTFTDSGTTTGCRGVVAVEGPSSVTVFATTADVTTNRLVSWVDTGAGTPSSTLLSTAALNTIYRGVSVGPR